jgi:hypothetical protein
MAELPNEKRQKIAMRRNDRDMEAPKKFSKNIGKQAGGLTDDWC